jgi:hypothetical protein
MREEQGPGKKQILVVEDESLIAADFKCGWDDWDIRCRR